MTDKELLEKAAKAAGILLYGVVWNPLTDDGDALRLAVKLGLIGYFRINLGSGAVSTEDPTAQPRPMLYACEDMEAGDPYAATRRAIVRAAASIAGAD